MAQVWLKVRVWTKGIVFALIALYAVVFVAMNWNVRVEGVLDFVFTKFDQKPYPRVLAVMAVSAVVSVIGWWLLRTVLRTLRQFREMGQRNRTAKLEKEMADLRVKAGVTKGGTKGD